MKNLNILNSLNILQKVTLGEENSILFFFGDTPNWGKKNLIYDVANPKAYYEVVKVYLKGDLKDVYWKVHRYAGELMFLQVENNKINVWEGEISDYQEEWGTFDDIEVLDSDNYECYTVDKSADDWRKDYGKLRKKYDSLYKKKSFQLNEYRAALQEEFKEKINSRMKSLRNYNHEVDERTLSQVYSALNDKHSGVKIDSVIEFLFDK